MEGHMNTDPTPEELELNIALSESLACKTCAIQLPRATYQRHLQSQIYVSTRDPPFVLSRAALNGLSAFGLTAPVASPGEDQGSLGTVEMDDDGEDTTIAPHEIPPRKRRPGYQALMTGSQRETYERQVKKYVAEVPNRDVAMARYHADYHVHLHWLSRRGALSLCRDVKEMHELRKWRWKMAQLDVQAAEEAASPAENTGSGEDATEDGTPKKPPRRVTARRWGWPGDSHLFMMYQTALWRQKWMVRQKHLDEVRIKWTAIMEERRRQRKCVKVRLFWGHGYKNLLREIELEEPWVGEHIIR
ncbi:hypothetical protein P170DRAFT_478886 [Aspergillus steynii IBT 23096]|uniref:Uncharacterized protein n=1 Tax=Aspergillus steynii IBT 23096 TaxID=1392250 RepID=A0A2I2FZA7_9EURO|nr:uncharacterized protein P170DRAFT_478886 [Aspergillus steynii IBT 23096]PLB45955.1 hypothetical protein P170DRAFT_478886 [Aspergillus steynii IBT 23096]